MCMHVLPLPPSLPPSLPPHLNQSTKMILKFRETHIGNLERGRKGETAAAAASPPDDGETSVVSGIWDILYYS